MPVPTDGCDETTSLAETVGIARDRIEELRTSDGEFVVACRDSGVQPEPVTDARFESYDDAERACAVARRYREAMRELDPALTRHELVVSAVEEGAVEVACVREATDQRRANGLPHARQTVTLAGNGNDEWLRVENGTVVHFTGPDSLLDDEFVTRQLDSKLSEDA
ncbi:hypothetical protein ACFR9U_21020 [Halorientalis brevis]|uniref:DUF7552 domain-containing protein n=1 Tax=Halorientalis brevis TaxID=1126241 RepID=A0ABD6CGM7_9EURY|nr:hypothetical protein [Halorientalis brevis]